MGSCRGIATRRHEGRGRESYQYLETLKLGGSYFAIVSTTRNLAFPEIMRS